jgi:hypothetical protein
MTDGSDKDMTKLEGAAFIITAFSLLRGGRTKGRRDLLAPSIDADT